MPLVHHYITTHYSLLTTSLHLEDEVEVDVLAKISRAKCKNRAGNNVELWVPLTKLIYLHTTPVVTMALTAKVLISRVVGLRLNLKFPFSVVPA